MILFRTDANEHIGLGHLMRCLSIADALKNHGLECMFIIADDFSRDIIHQRGYHSKTLDSRYNNMEAELDSLIEIIQRQEIQCIIIDSYYITKRYFSEIRLYTKIVYIDDILLFDYPVDILINYNIFSKIYDYQKLYLNSSIIPVFLLGTDYIPLREEFCNCSFKKQADIAKSVFVSTGGTDIEHFTIKLIRYISRNLNDFFDYTFHFVVGSANQDKEAIDEISKNIENINIHYNVKKMRDLMLPCEIAVSAAGSTLYELCACGIPTITYSLADNQIPAANAFGEIGLMINAGDIRDDTEPEKTICDLVIRLSKDKERRQKMAFSAHQIVNGRGADIIANILSEYLQ